MYFKNLLPSIEYILVNSRISGGDGDGGAVRWQACRIGSRCGDDVGGGDDNGGGGGNGGGDGGKVMVVVMVIVVVV